MCEAEKRLLEVKSKEWEAEGIKKESNKESNEVLNKESNKAVNKESNKAVRKKELEMYQTMVDKGFSISSIASIFSVSEITNYNRTRSEVHKMSIIKLTPAFKDYLWGGTKLKENYGKKTDMDPVAESWELSVHPDGPSIVASGEYQGLSFPKYLEKKGKGVLGTKGNTFEFFPILIKFIDAKQPLSIQVHPDNEYALRVEHEYGKNRNVVYLRL